MFSVVDFFIFYFICVWGSQFREKEAALDESKCNIINTVEAIRAKEEEMKELERICKEMEKSIIDVRKTVT